MNTSMRGQIILLFAASLILIVAVAGLLIDGGFLLATHRKAQAAADTGALAAAEAASRGAGYVAAAQTIAGANGFSNAYTDCAGTARTDGVVVNRPPSSASQPAHRTSEYVEVITTRPMLTAFAKVLGMPCFLVTARAVARIASSSIPTCSFCALTKWGGDGSDNPFLMDNSGHLRVDGDILVNGKALTNPAACVPTGSYTVCGKALHLYHTGGTPGDTTQLSARTISLAGGWESLGGTQAKADDYAQVAGHDCPYHPDPNIYASQGYPPSKVCIGMTPLDDPLDPAYSAAGIPAPLASNYAPPQKGVGVCPNDGYDPAYPIVKVPTGSLGSPAKLGLTGSTPNGPFFTICPGLYFGGFSVVGDNRNVHVKMMPGLYFMVGGGFQVSGTASIDGSAGVTIYNSGGAQSYSYSTPQGTGLVPGCTVGTPTPECKTLTAALTGPNSTNVETLVTYTLTLTGPVGQLAPVGGTVAFYDGDNPISACATQPLTPVLPVSTRKATASCDITYTEFGTRWITAVYSGDDIYAAVGDNKQTTVHPNANLGIDDVDICTGPACGATGACTSGGPCNQVLLHAPAPGTGDYPGMLIFQDRTSNLGLRFWPDKGLPDCVGSGSPPSWMTAGVPGGPNPSAAIPQPCGALGGLSGTIYAPESRPTTGWDAAVNIRADGVANLQVIAGRIALQYNTDVRFTFATDSLAGGSVIRLVE